MIWQSSKDRSVHRGAAQASPVAPGEACGRLLRRLYAADGACLHALGQTFGGGPAALSEAVRHLLVAGYVVLCRDQDGARVYLTRRSRAALNAVS